MKRLITSVLVLTCLVAAPLSAQTDQTGVLEGTVQDVAGGAIALADVRIALEDGSPTGVRAGRVVRSADG